MDKSTLSNYGWVVIAVLVLSVMIALATPFGTFVADGFKATYTGLFQTGDNAMDTALSAVGVSNKLPCGHGIKEAGDHSQKECGHYNCQDTDCGCVPASCGVEGHWSGDGMDHTTRVYHTGHKYACQCSGWVVPEGGTFTMYSAVNGKKEYVAGEQLPCGYSLKDNDRYAFGDYVYRISTGYSLDAGWVVSINTAVTDKNQSEYGPILKEICGRKVRVLANTFKGCENLVKAPAIPETITYMYGTFRGCVALEGTIVIDTNLITQNTGDVNGTCDKCFNGVDMTNITLSGSASKDVLNLIGSTGNNWTPIE